ncbi:DUF6302 family protein [Streptomyces sp. NPDC006173]|uniref:DUF6302 family protein n=1 Tax=Streptomyces sp. NPDC006173 TaxID=3155349 RepID=UPI0033C55D22
MNGTHSSVCSMSGQSRLGVQRQVGAFPRPSASRFLRVTVGETRCGGYFSTEDLVMARVVRVAHAPCNGIPAARITWVSHPISSYAAEWGEPPPTGWSDRKDRVTTCRRRSSHHRYEGQSFCPFPMSHRLSAHLHPRSPATPDADWLPRAGARP